MSGGPRVLVTGASVAGPAVAFWLGRAGYAVTVVERASQLRRGGQNVDVRATGREVLQRMGLEDAVRRRNTGEVGTRFLDESGRTVSEFPVDPREGSDGPTADLEVLRGALAEILVEACPDEVGWRFGTHVAGVREDADGLDVTFSDGVVERFDLLVVAEGVGSATRDLVLADGVRQRPLGMTIAFGTIERTPADDDWWNVCVVPGSRQISLRPDDEGTTRAMLTFLADEPVLEGLDDAEVRSALRERFADAGWEAPRILEGLDQADDLYVDHLRQVDCATYHEGRVVLLGDAAWCVTPIGGGGTSLALVGAYVLASALTQAGPGAHEEAFARYEAWMRPLVEEAQQLPPGTPRVAAPRTRVGVGVLRLATRVAALGPVRSLAARITRGPQARQDLPPEPVRRG